MTCAPERVAGPGPGPGRDPVPAPVAEIVPRPGDLSRRPVEISLSFFEGWEPDPDRAMDGRFWIEVRRDFDPAPSMEPLCRPLVPWARAVETTASTMRMRYASFELEGGALRAPPASPAGSLAAAVSWLEAELAVRSRRIAGLRHAVPLHETHFFLDAFGEVPTLAAARLGRGRRGRPAPEVAAAFRLLAGPWLAGVARFRIGLLGRELSGSERLALARRLGAHIRPARILAEKGTPP